MIEEIINFISKFTDFKIPGKIRLTTDDNIINIPLDDKDINNLNKEINKTEYKPSRNTKKYTISSEFIMLEMYSVNKDKNNIIFYKLVSCQTGRVININKKIFELLYTGLK